MHEHLSPELQPYFHAGAWIFTAGSVLAWAYLAGTKKADRVLRHRNQRLRAELDRLRNPKTDDN